MSTTPKQDTTAEQRAEFYAPALPMPGYPPRDSRAYRSLLGDHKPCHCGQPRTEIAPAQVAVLTREPNPYGNRTHTQDWIGVCADCAQIIHEAIVTMNRLHDPAPGEQQATV